MGRGREAGRKKKTAAKMHKIHQICSQEELRHKRFDTTGEFVKTVNRVLLHEWFVLQYVLQIVSKLHPLL